MKDLFTFEQVDVRQGMDLVELQIDSNKMRLYYQHVFTICSKIRGSGTFALRYERNHPSLARELDKYGREPCIVPMHPQYRRSGFETNVKHWDVGYTDQLVVLTFDDLIAKFHYTDAFRLQAHLRRAAKQAKHWAGDSGRHWNIYANLTTAEDNDKFAFG